MRFIRPGRLLLFLLLFICIHILTVDLFTTNHIHIDLIQFTQKDGERHVLFWSKNYERLLEIRKNKGIE